MRSSRTSAAAGRRLERPLYDLRGDAGMVLEVLRESGLAIVALPRRRAVPAARSAAKPPRDGDELAAMIADAIDASLVAGRWDARVIGGTAR